MAGVRVDGLKEAVSATRKASVEVGDLKEGFDRIGQEMVARARSLAPSRTGRLHASIRASRGPNSVVVSAGGGRVDYAWYVAYGSIHNPNPVQFMESAAESTPIDQIAAEAVDNAIAKSGL